jgi:hypothetical protein
MMIRRRGIYFGLGGLFAPVVLAVPSVVQSMWDLITPEEMRATAPLPRYPDQATCLLRL